MSGTTCTYDGATIMDLESEYVAKCREGDPERYIKPGDVCGHLRIVRFDGFVPDAAATPNRFGETGSLDIFEARCDCGQTILVSGTNWRHRRVSACGMCHLGDRTVVDAASVHGDRIGRLAA